MFDGSQLKSIFDHQQVLLIASMQSYCDCILGDPTRCRFPSSVDSLSDLRPKGEVGSNDDVVDQIGVRVAIAGPLSVNGSKS